MTIPNADAGYFPAFSFWLAEPTNACDGCDDGDLDAVLWMVIAPGGIAGCFCLRHARRWLAAQADGIPEHIASADAAAAATLRKALGVDRTEGEGRQ